MKLRARIVIEGEYETDAFAGWDPASIVESEETAFADDPSSFLGLGPHQTVDVLVEVLG